MLLNAAVAFARLPNRTFGDRVLIQNSPFPQVNYRLPSKLLAFIRLLSDFGSGDDAAQAQDLDIRTDIDQWASCTLGAHPQQICVNGIPVYGTISDPKGAAIPGGAGACDQGRES